MSNLVVHKGLTNQQVSKVLNLSHKRHGRVTTESYFNLIHTKNNRKNKTSSVNDCTVEDVELLTSPTEC